MAWQVIIHQEFAPEFRALDEVVKERMLAGIGLLKEFGPRLSRPHVDTLNGSKHQSMKELRFEANRQEWRAAFAFDPKRCGVMLVAASKSGMSQKLFYRRLIAFADSRYDDYFQTLRKEGSE